MNFEKERRKKKKKYIYQDSTFSYMRYEKLIGKNGESFILDTRQNDYQSSGCLYQIE
jgi:hypothetical protein